MEVPSSPQQTNGYDCGIFVVAMAEQLAAWHAGQAAQSVASNAAVNVLQLWEAQTLPAAVNPACVDAMRGSLLQSIQELMDSPAAR